MVLANPRLGRRGGGRLPCSRTRCPPAAPVCTLYNVLSGRASGVLVGWCLGRHRGHSAVHGRGGNLDFFPDRTIRHTRPLRRSEPGDFLRLWNLSFDGRGALSPQPRKARRLHGGTGGLTRAPKAGRRTKAGPVHPGGAPAALRCTGNAAPHGQLVARRSSCGVCQPQVPGEIWPTGRPALLRNAVRAHRTM
jgi:hypothetical protein